MVDEASIPVTLKAAPQWVCYRIEQRDGRATKVPINPATGAYASVNDAETWHGFEDALRYYRATEEVDGLGFVFADGPYAGVDLDDCRDPDTSEVTDLAAEIMTRLDSYTEISPSGTGLHVLLQGRVPDGGNRKGALEIYSDSRFFTVTGDHVAGTPATIEDRREELRTIHEEYIADSDGDTDSVATGTSFHGSLSDAEILSQAQTADNGAKFCQLWRGDWESDYPSHSEADLALCSMLAFWTGGNPERIDTLFRQSGLMRPKWDEDRGAQTYGELTIKTALASQTEFYDPETDT